MRPARTRRTVAALGLTVSLMAALAACGGSSPSASDAAAEKLSERVETLRDDVRELQDRVDELEAGGAMAGDEETGEEEGAGDEEMGDEPAGEKAAVGTKASAGHGTTEATHAAAGGDAHGAETTAAAHGATPHWSYADAEHWGHLVDEFATCNTGAEQSPIDLTKAAPVAIDDAQLAYHPSAATIVNNGHTVQVNLADAGTATIDGHEYTLVQFHFHAPSEHTVDGEHTPVEVHFVHKDAEGKLAVIGVMVLTGAAHEGFGPVVAASPSDSTEVPLAEPIDVRALLPVHLSAYRYAGSLTTPPCSEGVTWSVLVEPIRWSAAQVKQLSAHFAEPNNRPVQPVGERTLRLDTSAG